MSETADVKVLRTEAHDTKGTIEILEDNGEVVLARYPSNFGRWFSEGYEYATWRKVPTSSTAPGPGYAYTIVKYSRSLEDARADYLARTKAGNEA